MSDNAPQPPNDNQKPNQTPPSQPPQQGQGQIPPRPQPTHQPHPQPQQGRPYQQPPAPNYPPQQRPYIPPQPRHGVPSPNPNQNYPQQYQPPHPQHQEHLRNYPQQQQHQQYLQNRQRTERQQKIVAGVKGGLNFTASTAGIAFRILWKHVLLLVFLFVFNLVLVLTDLVQYSVYDSAPNWIAFTVLVVLNLVAFNVFYIITVRGYVQKRMAWELWAQLESTIGTLMLRFMDKIFPEKDGQRKPPPKKLVTFTNILTGWIDKVPAKVQSVVLRILEQIPIYNIVLELSQNTDSSNKMLAVSATKSIDNLVNSATQTIREIKFMLLAVGINIVVIIAWFIF